MMLSLFRSHGFVASCAYDGADAVREAASSRPDVIVMDFAMPIIDGYEAARRIRQDVRGRQPVLIALTG